MQAGLDELMASVLRGGRGQLPGLLIVRARCWRMRLRAASLLSEDEGSYSLSSRGERETGAEMGFLHSIIR